MKKLLSILTIAGALIVPATASAAEFEGTVVSKAKKSFRLSDSERGTKRIYVNANTRFERVTFSGLKAGDKNIEVVAKRANGKWIASEVERSGGGGNHGGDDD